MNTTYLYVKSFLANHEIYWRLHWYFSKAKFFLFSTIFRVRFAFRNISLSANIARAISSASLRPFLLAILLGSLLYILSLLFAGISIQELFANLLHWITPVFDEISLENTGSYDGFFIGIATVVGLFLTLYLTNLSTLAGSLYAKLPKELRDLYIQDRVGNSYVALLIFLTLSSLFVIAVSLLTDFRPKLFIYVFGVLSLIAIQAFAILGQRAFQFFDPTSLFGEMVAFADIWIGQATIKGFLWNDSSFQNHYHVRTNRILKGFFALLDLANEEANLNKEPLRLLHREIARFLTYFVSKKRLIPTKSKFFEEKIEHKLWYLAEHSDVDLATKHHTDLMPNKKMDTYWIETLIFEHLFHKFRACLKDRKEVAVGMLEDYSGLIPRLGTEWEIKYACDRLDEIAEDVFSLIEQYPSDETIQKVDLGLLEIFAIIPINMFLNFLKYLEDQDFDNEKFIEISDFSKLSDVYHIETPLVILPRLETIYGKLLFERRIESDYVTPNWHIRQEVFQELALNMKSNFELFVQRINQSIYSKVGLLVNQKKFIAAMILTGRGLEYNHKLLTHLPKLQDVAKSLDKAKKEDTLPWSTWTWDKDINEVNIYIKKLYEHQTSCIKGLSLSELPKDIPDFFGKAVHFAGELCFKYAKENDLANLKIHFPSYFTGALQVYEKLRLETKDWLAESAVHAFTQPFIELVEISGFLYFLAEFHHNEKLWFLAKSVWDRYFEIEGGVAARLTQISQILHHDRRSFLLGNRQFRTQWRMQIDDLLRNLPRRSIRNSTTPLFLGYTEVDHDSRLVRLIAGTSSDFPMSLYDGVDIFVEYYLQKFEEAKGLDFGTRNMIREDLDETNDEDT